MFFGFSFSAFSTIYSIYLYLTNSAYQNDLMEINEKIEKANSEVEQFQSRTSENGKLAEERRKFIADSDAKLRMLHLEITEIESIEYPQEADVEVMVSLQNRKPNVLRKWKKIYIDFLFINSNPKWMNSRKSWQR